MVDSDGGTVLATQTEQTQHYLRQFLQENASLLLGIIRSYIVRMRLAQGTAAIQSLAMEVLHDATLEALAHADRLNTVTQQRAWFLAIATNILKRKRDEAIRLHILIEQWQTVNLRVTVSDSHKRSIRVRATSTLCRSSPSWIA